MLLTEIATKSNTYQQWYQEDTSFWDGSEFEKLKVMSSRKKGAQAERLTADIMEGLGCDVPRDRNGNNKKPYSSSDFDLFIDGFRVEVKMSTAWDNTLNKFTWQQLRNQDYQRVIFVGINPNHLDMWWCTKEELRSFIFGRDKYRQHAGKNGGQELYWIHTSGGDTVDVPSFFKTMGEW